jgi:hypothetical protein
MNFSEKKEKIKKNESIKSKKWTKRYEIKTKDNDNDKIKEKGRNPVKGIDNIKEICSHP